MATTAADRPPGRWVGRAAWMAAAVFGLIVLASVGLAVAWFRWHPVQQYQWTLTSVSSDGRTLNLDVSGHFGTPRAKVKEASATVNIAVTSSLRRGIAINCGGEMRVAITVRLQAPLARRTLTGSHESCG